MSKQPDDGGDYIMCSPVSEGAEPLYAHPSAQPASVPDEMKEWPNAKERERSYVDGWNACRAAMLRGQKS